MSGIAYEVSTWILPVLLAVTLHEAAHGYVARWHGDDTAARQGRVTLNPLRHIDPVGTVVLPALLLLVKSPVLFGYAKPVPVDPRRLRRPKRDMVLVALAGPGANLLLAAAAALLLHALVLVPEAAVTWTARTLSQAIVLNLVLAVFNMLPLPPLDGGRVLVGLLPAPLDRRLAALEPIGLPLLLALLFLAPLAGRQIGLDLNPLAWLVWPVVRLLYNGLALLTGLG